MQHSLDHFQTLLLINRSLRNRCGVDGLLKLDRRHDGGPMNTTNSQNEALGELYLRQEMRNGEADGIGMCGRGEAKRKAVRAGLNLTRKAHFANQQARDEPDKAPQAHLIVPKWPAKTT